MPERTKPVIVVPGDEPLQIGDSPQLARLRGLADIEIYRDRPATPEEQIRRAAVGDIVINSRGNVRWPAELLQQLPRLRMMSTCSIGVDAVDLEAARRQGVLVCNVPGKTATVVAEHALALMLAIARRVAFATAQLRAGRWTSMHNTFLSGKTLGVVGTGSVGSEMVRLGHAIGMRVQAWTFHPSDERAETLGLAFVDLDELLATSDVVSLHVKLTPASRRLIGRRELSLMKPGSLLVNTARGGLVDTEALVDALQRGHLGGAAVDVFETEPLPPDAPILSCDQIVLTPHSADQNPEGMDLLNRGAVDNVLAFLNGTPQNVVN